ncbi:MAG: hypothetical protein OXC14_21415 [Rhodospirillaceae bacterium]|nr:hypothetical protein [Rhodospirillaceae bacterium]
MRNVRVIGIDPAPAKRTTVFEGEQYLSMSAAELREFVDEIGAEGSATLVCWDAPLTGPADPTSAGTLRFDYTKRPIERFFSLSHTGFKTPDGISVRGYGACPHWTITRSILGLPRVGPFDAPESRLPLRLVADPSERRPLRPTVVEIHPGLAAWLWCRRERRPDASWKYKGDSAKSRGIRAEMWAIVLQRSGFNEDLPKPGTDDEFDAAVGYILGRTFVGDGHVAGQGCGILGNRKDGAFLVPLSRELTDAWVDWTATRRDSPKANEGGNDDMQRGTPASASRRKRRKLGATAGSGMKGLGKAVKSRIRKSASSAAASTKAAARQSSDAARTVFSGVTVRRKRVLTAALALSDGLLMTAQGLLASSLSADLNELLQATVKGSATIYDKALDAEYLRTHIGGANHRMFDGGHTIAGAIGAVRDASPDDTVIAEAMGFLEAMFKDLSTPKGLPLANWDKATYDHASAYLQSNFGIPRDWFYDINSYDGADVLGGVIGFVAVTLSWNRADTEKFSGLVSSMGVSGVFGANPFLLILAVVALARAFHKAHHSREYVELADGLLKGGISTGGALAAASQVAVVGGPAGLALLAGLSAGVIVNRTTRNLSVVQLHQFVSERATAAASEIRSLAGTGPKGPDEIPQTNTVQPTGIS